MIVKPYDYIIGRLRGEFSPGDPGIYRGNRRNQTTSLVNNQPIQTKNNVRTNFGTHADAYTHELHPSNPVDPMGSQERVHTLALGILRGLSIGVCLTFQIGLQNVN